jgi:hypothetical protein
MRRRILQRLDQMMSLGSSEEVANSGRAAGTSEEEAPSVTL